jgi:hypothetical protein
MLKPDKPEEFVGKVVSSGDRLGVIHNVGHSGKFAFVKWNGCGFTVCANWSKLEVGK